MKVQHVFSFLARGQFIDVLLIATSLLIPASIAEIVRQFVGLHSENYLGELEIWLPRACGRTT